MANNFRYVVPSGLVPYYVSKAGSDSNDGLTPDTPKATLSGGLSAIAALTTQTNVIIIIGSGTYEEAVVGNNKMGPTSQIVADGNVTFRGNGANSWSLSLSLGGALNGITFDNYSNVTFKSSVTSCIIKNVATVGFVSSVANNNIWINCPSILAVFNHSTSIFIDCTLTGSHNSITNCYFNANCLLTMSATLSQFDYNNIMGLIRTSATGTYKSLADYTTDNPTWNTHSFNLPPKFNSVAKLDFTLAVDSPHIGAGQGGVNIGGTSYAVPSVFATDPEWQTANGAIISSADGVNPDLIISGGDLVLAPGKTTGTITGAPKKIAANPQTITMMACNGFFLFNKSQAGGSATNNNVPDANVFAAGTAGANPDRLSYEMRWTDNDIMPGSASDWINANQGTPGNFMRFEWNKQPLFDNTGFGNGSASFISTGATSPVSAIWIQRKITLTNAYV